MNSPDTVVAHRQDVAPQALAAYWTPQKMAQAIPVPVPMLPAKMAAQVQAAAGPRTKGDPAGPDGGVALALRPCFVTTRVLDLNVPPQSAVGKLYMTFGAQDFVGSAWVVGERTIGTAGHCVYDHATGWATNVLFAGRYDAGAAIGRWAIPDLGSLFGWTNDRDFAYDMAMGISPQPIRPIMGKLGWMANIPPNQGPYTELGYPASPLPGYPFDGERMWQSVGEYLGGTSIIQACGNMTGGCSGGPWAILRNDLWYANGLNSHRYTNPDHMYSPYFGDGFVNLISWMQTSGGD